MNLPITLKIFRKVELLQILHMLNERYLFQLDRYKKVYKLVKEKDKEENPDRHIPIPTWKEELMFLWWYWYGSVKLYSEFTVNKIRKAVNEKGSIWLYVDAPFDIDEKKKLDGEFNQNLLNNLVVNGFAEFVDDNMVEKGVRINRKGVLLSEILNEIIFFDKKGRKHKVKSWPLFKYSFLLVTAQVLLFYGSFAVMLSLLNTLFLLDDLKFFFIWVVESISSCSGVNLLPSSKITVIIILLFIPLIFSFAKNRKIRELLENILAMDSRSGRE